MTLLSSTFSLDLRAFRKRRVKPIEAPDTSQTTRRSWWASRYFADRYRGCRCRDIPPLRRRYRVPPNASSGQRDADFDAVGRYAIADRATMGLLAGQAARQRAGDERDLTVAAVRPLSPRIKLRPAMMMLVACDVAVLSMACATACVTAAGHMAHRLWQPSVGRGAQRCFARRGCRHHDVVGRRVAVPTESLVQQLQAPARSRTPTQAMKPRNLSVGSKSQIIGAKEQGPRSRAVYMMLTSPGFHPISSAVQDNGTRISRATIIDDLPAPEGAHGEVARRSQSLSARASLHAWARPKVVREASRPPLKARPCVPIPLRD